jgi:hypothetical protein
MDRIRLIQHKGKTILLEDFSNMRPGPDFFEALYFAERLTRSSAPKSVLALFDATNSVFNAEVLSALKNFVKGNTPYIRHTAVVGIRGILQVGLMAVSKAAGRPMQTFNTREEALEFLAGLD